MMAEPQVRMTRFKGDAMIVTAADAGGSTRCFIWHQLSYSHVWTARARSGRPMATVFGKLCGVCVYQDF